MYCETINKNRMSNLHKSIQVFRMTNYSMFSVRCFSVLFTCLLMLTGELSALKPLPLIIPVNGAIPNVSSKLPERYNLLAINHILMDTINPLNHSSFLIPNIPTPDNIFLTLNVQRYDVIAPSGYIVEGTESGNRIVDIPKYFSVSGTVVGKSNSFVYLTIFEKYCAGYIELKKPSGEPYRLIIAPDDVTNKHPVMVIYNEADIPNAIPKTINCSAETLPGYAENFKRIVNSMQQYKKGHTKENTVLERKILVSRIAVECDPRFYAANNSSISLAANYAIALVGASSAIYRRDVSISLEVPFLRIWSSGSPYNGTSKYELLSQLTDYWNQNMQSVKRSATVLLSDNAIGGGLGELGAVCEENRSYCVCGPRSLLSLPAAGYEWDIDVLSHELGHVFGAAHTHSCDWSPAIDSCYESEGGCYTQVTSRIGTVMSYCHLYYSIDLRFHPRVASLIRYNMETKSCISHLSGTPAFDVSVVEINNPSNGSRYLKGSSSKSSAIIRNGGTQALNNVSVSCAIRHLNNTQITSTSRNITVLAAGASTEVQFDDVLFQEAGLYLTEVSVSYSGDEIPQNNKLSQPFEIITNPAQKSISVLSPNGGESFTAGSNITVSWKQTGMANVFLDYTSDNGLSWNTLAFNTSAPKGSYLWTVPPINTKQARIRIRDINFSNIEDVSDAVFSIVTEKDVQAVEFASPLPNSDVKGEISPLVLVRNNGTKTQTDIPVRLRFISRSNGNEVYSETVHVPSIQPDSVVSVSFPKMRLLPDGMYIFIARTLLSGDQNISNDSIGRSSEIKGFSPPLPMTGKGENRLAILNWRSAISPKIASFTLYKGTTQRALRRLVSVQNTVLSYLDENLTNNQEYFYCVTSQSNPPDSLYIDGISVVPKGTGSGLPAAPVLVSPKDNAMSLAMPFTLSWASGEPTVFNYNIQIATDAAFTNIVNERTQKETTGYSQFLDFNTTYFWRVRSMNGAGVGDWSQVRKFQTSDKCPTFAYNGNGLNSYMNIPDFKWSGTNITIEFWNYVESKNIQTSWAFEMGDDKDGSNACRAAVPHGDGKLYWDYGYVDFGARLVIPYSQYTDKWTHVALMADDTTLRIYLDGQLAGSAPRIGYPTPMKGLVIGTLQKETFFTHFGKIDEFRVWNGARSEQEIQYDMNHSIEPQTGLMGYWKFDEGTGLNVKDASGNNNPGVLTNASIWSSSDSPISCSEGTSDANENPSVQEKKALSIYPNPTSLSATVSFRAKKNQYTRIEMYSAIGEKAMTIFEGYPHSDNNSMKFDTGLLSPGVYYCLLHCGEELERIPVVIHK